MKPEASFSYSVSALAVDFQDRSSNGPTHWLWDFGDGSNSNVQNPSHTYSRRGFFVVTLIATNSDGASEPFKLSVGVSDTGINPLPRSIYDMVLSYIPTNVDISVGEIDGFIKKWQLYLQPLVENPTVDPTNVFDEFYWPPLVNQLIAELVALDLIIQAVNILISTSSNSGGGTTGGSMKKVVTGPTQAEWYDAASTTDSINNIIKSGGALDTLIKQTCMLAKRVRIYLPICEDLRNSPTVPEIFKPIVDTLTIIV